MVDEEGRAPAPFFTVRIGATVSIFDSVEQLDHALTAAELARLLNLNRITIYRLAQQGRIPAFRIGSAVRFDPRAVASWLRKQGGAL